MINNGLKFWVALSVSLFSGLSLASETIILAYSDTQSYPFQMGSGRDVADPPGLSIDLINKSMSELGINVRYVRLPGKRVLQYLKTGKVDGAFILSHNAQREKYASYPMVEGKLDSTKRVATLGYYFYKLKNKPLDWDGENLTQTNKQVGAHLGFSIVRELEKRKVKVYEVKTTSQLFGMLKLQRLAAIAVQDSTALDFLNSNDYPDVEQVQPAIITKDYYLVFGQKFTDSHPNLVNQVWDTIGSSRDSVLSENRHKYVD
ncbi:substrate-binding periplasmic protein [Vibrio cortegadensis]|uniref:substrate-binding periplasmic protein n=1 Tax=Vibrio cortegadensis TaxID=1328770 RepID=UPI00352E2334